MKYLALHHQSPESDLCVHLINTVKSDIVAIFHERESRVQSCLGKRPPTYNTPWPNKAPRRYSQTTTPPRTTSTTSQVMPLGRPRAPGTEAERAEARRAKVRANVQAFRRRQKEKKLAEAASKAVQDDEGSGRVGGVICRDGFLDASSTSAETASVSARSSPGLTPSFQTFPEQDYVDPDSWIWQLTRDLAANGPYQDLFVSAMQQDGLWSGSGESDVSSYEPFRAFAGCGSTWFHVVMMETVDPGLGIINDACLAAALNIIGSERGDQDIAMSAAYIQSRALRSLRYSLQHWGDGAPLCPVSLSMAALTCAMTELVTTRSWDSFAGHLNGVGSLLSYHDPASLRTQSARELFYGFRSLEAAFAFNYARSTFLSESRWIDLPWKDQIAISQHPLHTMLDVGFRLLPELSQQHSPRSSRVSDLRTRLQRLRRIAADLDAWEQEFRAQQPRGLHTRKEAEWPGLYDYAFDFASLPSATAYATYAGVRIKLASALYATQRDLARHDHSVTSAHRTDTLLQGLRWSRQAFQSLEYFHTGPLKDCGWLATLFPFDAAWEYVLRPELAVHVDLSAERDWSAATAQRFAELEVPVFTWR